MASKVKQPSQRAVVGKSRDSRAKVMLLALLFIIVGSVVAGTLIVRHNNIDAKAAGYPTFAGYDQVSFHGCKVAINSGYGPLYEVRLYASRNTPYLNRTVSALVKVQRTTSTINGQVYTGGTISSRSWSLGTGKSSDVFTTFTSRLLPDNIVTTVTDSVINDTRTQVTSPNTLQNCL